MALFDAGRSLSSNNTRDIVGANTFKYCSYCASEAFTRTSAVGYSEAFAFKVCSSFASNTVKTTVVAYRIRSFKDVKLGSAMGVGSRFRIGRSYCTYGLLLCFHLTKSYL